METATKAAAPSIRFHLNYNPLSPLPGSGPSEMTVDVGGETVPYARVSNTQNPNYLRAGTEWVHGDFTPQFAKTANGYAQVLRDAAAALSTVPSDRPVEGYTKNGAFELSLGGSTWSGSLLRDGRGPVKDAVNALRSLARDLKHGVPGERNSV